MPTLPTLARSLLFLALLALPGLGAAQYAPYAPAPDVQPPPPPPNYPPPPPGYPPGYGPPPTASPPPGYAATYPQQPRRVDPADKGGVQLSAFTGWDTSSNIHTSGGYLKIGDAQSFGAAIDIAKTPGAKLELKWVYSRPTVQFSSQNFAYPSSSKFDVDTNYFLIGGLRGFRKGKVEPFFGGSFGAVFYSPGSYTMGAKTYNPSDTWYFAFGLGGGAKIFVAEKVALRLGIEMLAPVYFTGVAAVFGSGGGGMAVTGGVPTISGNFTVGLTFAP